MTLRNNSNPSDDDRRSAKARQSDDSLQFPSAPRAYYNRMLVNAYLDNCKRGLVGQNKLITSVSDMEREDRVALRAMASEYRQSFYNKMRKFGFGDAEKDLTLRILHPVVAVGVTQREYHLYVDIVSAQGGCWFLDFEAAGRFQKGPAAVQLSNLGPPVKSSMSFVTRLFSLPAFNEALKKLVVTPFEQVQKNPRDFIAFGWIMEAIAKTRNDFRGRGALDSSKPLKPISPTTVKDFMWTGERRPFEFACCVENAYYSVRLTLNSRTRQPDVYVYEETF